MDDLVDRHGPLDVARWSRAPADDRALWRHSRQTLERQRSASTPLGERRDRGSGALGAALAAADRLLGLTPLRRHLVRQALAVERIELTLRLPGLPPDLEGYRIAQVADPHFDGLPGLGARLARLLAGQDLDLLVLTGDYRLRSRGRFVEHAILDDLRQVLRAAAPRDGALAVLGNHDTWEMVEPIEALGVRMLINQSVMLRRGAARLRVTGTDDVNRQYTPAARAALQGAGGADLALALVHSPELAGMAAAAGYGLYLCGHTHGGQVALPGGRPILRHLHCHGELASGPWRLGRMHGYTSRGAGISGMALRLNCRGEVTIFTLAREDA